MANLEIEKKYLIKSLPDNLNDYPHYKIEQGYVYTNPVIRIRKKTIFDGEKIVNQKHILTIKGDGLLSRQEFELTIDEKAFNDLSKKVEGNIISKTRYNLPLEDNLKIELDIFHDLFEGLIMGEIEFPDEDYAKKYNPPALLGKEVTENTMFHNSTMSKMSKSDISDLISFVHINSGC